MTAKDYKPINSNQNEESIEWQYFKIRDTTCRLWLKQTSSYQKVKGVQKHIGQKAEQESVEDYLRTCGKCGKSVESDMPEIKKQIAGARN